METVVLATVLGAGWALRTSDGGGIRAGAWSIAPSFRLYSLSLTHHGVWVLSHRASKEDTICLLFLWRRASPRALEMHTSLWPAGHVALTVSPCHFSFHVIVLSCLLQI